MSIKQYNDAIIADDQYEKEREYWLKKLSEVSLSTGFFYENKKENVKTRIMEEIKYELPDKISNRLNTMMNGSDYKLNMILISVVLLLMKRYMDNDDITIGVPIYKQEVDDELINTELILRNNIRDDMTFKEIILQVRECVTQSNKYANYPIGTLLKQLGIPFEDSKCNLIDVVVLLDNIHNRKYIDRIQPNLIFCFSRNEYGIGVNIEYNAAIYQKETIDRIFSMIIMVCENTIFNVDVQANDVDIILEEEKKDILYKFNTQHDFAIKRTVHQIVEEYASSNPEKIAIVYENEKITYSELNKKANRISRILNESGVGEDKTVAIILPRNPLMIQSILAIWKSAGAYIPLHEEYPALRILSILNNSNTEVLITASGLLDKEVEEHFKGRIIKLDLCDEELSCKDDTNLCKDININSLAYVIYTSGSTGEPKGAMVEHLGMMNHIYNKIHDLHINENSVIAQNASQCFDISVWQLFTAIILGGRTAIYSDKVIMQPEIFINALIKDNVSILEVVPSYLSVMVDYLKINAVCLDKLEYLMATGEELKYNLVKEWFTLYPKITIVNAYGPTEASDDITHHIIKNAQKVDRVPIGRPLLNNLIYIVDRNMKLCPVGVKGQICVSGISVGRGYLNDLETTSKFFLSDPFRPNEKVRLYKTGDIGRWNEDGIIEFFGRQDFQVKIRGFRIERGEIENVLLNYPNIKEAVVIDGIDESGNKYLCAYYTVYENVSIIELKKYLHKYLPYYMIPSYFVLMAELPINLNGKIDRKSLPKPNENKDEEYIQCICVDEMLKNNNNKSLAIENIIEDTHIISYEEKRKILEDFNGKKMDYPIDITISQLFEEQVKKYSERIAVVSGECQVTYKELNEKANQLAHLLRKTGVKAETIVGILLDGSIDVIVCIVAILKAGGAYVPIDLQYPQERIQYILGDSNATIILTNKENCNKVQVPNNVQVINIDNDEIYSGEKSNLECINDSKDLAYVIYTSGSTGQPKGSMIEHRHLINATYCWKKEYKLDEVVANLLSIASVSFDVFTGDIARTILTGGKIVLCSKMELSDYSLLYSVIKNNEITLLESTPAILIPFMNFLNENDIYPDKLKLVVIGSDKCDKKDFMDINSNFRGKVRVINSYGVTEATIDTSFYEIDDENINTSDNLPIGKPLPNMKLYILNNKKELQPIGVVGELYIGGDSVGRGYISNEGLTKEKFLVDPFSNNSMGRMYRTGDMARWIPSGDVEFLGRLDNQVQIDGIRVETNEIENILKSHPKVNEAIVVLKDTMNKGKYLCAYLIGEENISKREINEYLMSKIPMYMMPRLFLMLDKLPITINGKVDRKLLIDNEINNEKENLSASNHTEMEITRIWEGILKVKNINVKDDFFRIGGDSIRAIKLISNMNRILNTDLEIVDLFENGTIESISKIINKKTSNLKAKRKEELLNHLNSLKEDKLEKDGNLNGIEEIYPMSDVEKGMVFYYLKNSTSVKESGFAINHNQLTLEVAIEEFDTNVFVKALTCVVEKHPNLRASFNISDYKEPVKIIHNNTIMDYQYENISMMDKAQQKLYIQNLLNEDKRNPFNIEKSGIWRMRVFSVDNNIIFWMSFNQAIMDGWSLNILLPELFDTYNKIKKNPQYSLKKLGLNYKDMILDQLIEVEKKDIEIYWKKELANYEKLDFKRLSKIGNVNNGINSYSVILGKDEVIKLKTIAHKYKTSLKNICFSAYVCMMKWIFDKDDIVVAMMTHNRPAYEDSEKVVGCYLNMVPVRLKISNSNKLLDILEIVDSKLMELNKYSKVSIFSILKYIQEKTKDENPISDTMFNFTNFHNLKESKNLDMSSLFKNNLELDSEGRTNTLFDCNVDITFDECNIGMVSSLFEEATIKKYVRYYTEILNYISLEKNINMESIVYESKEAAISRVKPSIDFNFSGSPN